MDLSNSHKRKRDSDQESGASKRIKKSESQEIDIGVPIQNETSRNEITIEEPREWNHKDYLFLEADNSGGYGLIYKATRVSDLKEIAVKRISGTRGSFSKIGPFPKEYVLMKNLDHPNIVKVYDVFQKSNCYYITMDYYPGGDLYDFCENIPKMSLKLFFHLAKQLVSAVNYCHRNKIAHRDIKLDNFFIRDSEKPLPQIVLGDFGFATTIKGKKSTKMGAPIYLSPEMINEIPYRSEKIDIWSLGICFYFMFVGEFPFDDAQSRVEEIYDQILDKEVFPTVNVLSTPKDRLECVASVIKSMLSKTPKFRPTAENVKDLLDLI